MLRGSGARDEADGVRRNFGSGSVGSCGFGKGGAVAAEEMMKFLLIERIHGCGRSERIREGISGGGGESLVELSGINAVQRQVRVLAELLGKALGFHEGN